MSRRRLPPLKGLLAFETVARTGSFQAAAAELTLRVNGMAPGGRGTYRPHGISILVRGPAGATARVVVTRGFIQPVRPYAEFLHRQLERLQSEDFPANNAVDFQTVDVRLTGMEQDISDRFDFGAPQGHDFTKDRDRPFSIDADRLPVGIIGAIIDPDRENLPLGPVSEPIYLKSL